MMVKNETIISKVSELNEYIKETRGFLHTIPEVSSMEFETSKFLQEEVKKLGLPIEMTDETGFIATLETGKPGKTLALRADMDALALDEDPMNLKQEKKYVSKRKGACHACGHDGHMAIALGTMRMLYDMKDELSGTILFCFEDGEENGYGVHAMLDALSNRKVDGVYATHLTAFMDTETVSVEEGPRMAGAAETVFSVRGKSGHGSRPDLSINPVFAAAQVLSGISSAWCNQLDVTKTVTLGVTQIHGGTANNIIPEKVDIGGSLRFYDKEEGKKAVEVFKNVAELTAKAHNCTVELKGIKIACDPVINDQELSQLAAKGICELNFPNLKLVTGIRWFASEAFNEYTSRWPSVFAFVGVRNNEYGSGAEHHNVHFDIDEESLKYGLASTVKFAVDFLS